MAEVTKKTRYYVAKATWQTKGFQFSHSTHIFQSQSYNGLFDCKVLSRQHALLLYEEGRFFVMDTGSSNGTFVNNIRLSKSLEESKMTEIFTNDLLRFGSDVLDKVQCSST